MRPKCSRTALIWLLSLCALNVRGGEQGYYLQPALHGDRLVFVSEGDLWSARIPAQSDDTILAHRLTTGAGTEGRPTISADGKWLAFSGEYDGNVDAYIMPIDGGEPKRLTFHPSTDTVVGWTHNSQSVLFASDRDDPLERSELHAVSIHGGMPERFDFGPCSLAAMNPSGKLIAFNQWSNEYWDWKRYRGGTAPELWVGDLNSNTFIRLTDDSANDLFPMWLQGRVFFLSDRAGAPNVFSMNFDGSDVRQHTQFAESDSADGPSGYDVRWPSADTERRGSRIAFSQAGRIALLNVSDDSVRRLNIELASDRIGRRERFIDATESMTGFALSPDGERVLVDARGEVLSFPVEEGRSYQLTRSSNVREWGASYLNDETVIMITDQNEEQQIAIAAADGSTSPTLLTENRDVWLFPPLASPDGETIIFGDKTQRLHILNRTTMRQDLIDRSRSWEITDYRFSADGQWVAYTRPVENGYRMVYLYSVRTGRRFEVSNGLHDASEPRFDPKGRYLFFFEESGLNPRMGNLDFEHIYTDTTQVVAVPLAEHTPPPIPSLAEAAGDDLSKWADPENEEHRKSSPVAGGEDTEEDAAQEDDAWVMRVDTDGLSDRAALLPIEPGTYSNLEVVHGSIMFLQHEHSGLLDDNDTGTLITYNLLEEEQDTIAEKVSDFVISADRSTIAWSADDKLMVRGVSGGEPTQVAVAEYPLKVNAAQEWRQIFEEAWRLQRDFYWAPNYSGRDWDAMKAKYAALLPRIATREELNDLIGEMHGELRTSHTYIFGGDEHQEPTRVNVGMLGADITLAPGGFEFTRILPDQPWSHGLRNPLAMAHLDVKEGNMLLAINGQQLHGSSNIHDLMQGQAGKRVLLTIADDVTRSNISTVEITAIGDETPLRYAAWVEDNRRYVHEQSDGKLGYLHIPDMGGDGLVAFSRYFMPQIEKKGLVIDIRGNGGGFVSQMIIQRLAREPWAFMKPRHGQTERYPERSLFGHLAVIIDQHAGSDGDIFPESFRIRELGPLIGTRTWGGVVGIRMDKPFIDMGISSQPEFAWWEPNRGWSLENSGVAPDIEVPFDPADHQAGSDPQLDRAIAVLLRKLQDDPSDYPEEPALPEK